MCGICGIVYRDRLRAVDCDTLGASMHTLAHRGPDDSGMYVAPGVGIASQRLAVIDLSPRGKMPMQTPDGRYLISYNGEVYNHRQLRTTLQNAGVSFSSDTDTEVVLRMFEREGPGMLDKLNGMFAIAIWDTLYRRLFLARDRLGVKPLYYSETDERLMFASEEKALFALGHPAEFDDRVLPELLCFRHLDGDRTPFRSVMRLLPGHYLLWQDGRSRTHRWWHLGERAALLGPNHISNPPEWFRETFDDALELRRISDVPVGVLLSGGIDSSSIAASLTHHDARQIASFTVRFSERGYDESRIASALARQFGLMHHELQVAPPVLAQLLDRASWLSDEPLAHSSDLHLLAISDYAKKNVTVLLSGEGADETLGGYDRYFPLRFGGALAQATRTARAALRFRLPRRARKLARLIAAPEPDSCLLFNACDVLPEDLVLVGLRGEITAPFRSQIIAEAQQLHPASLFRQAQYLDLHTHLTSLLHRSDRMTMGASIECRTPFLDYRLVEGLAALPSSAFLNGSRGKPLLRRAIGSRLPADVKARRKWGFGVPWSQYLRTHEPFHRRIEALARDEGLLGAGCDPQLIASLTRRFFDGDGSCDALVLQLFMVAAWRQSYFDQVGRTRPPQPDDRPAQYLEAGGTGAC